MWIKLDTSSKEKPRCPESKQTVYYPIPRCNLNDKPCVLESGYDCPYYDDYLKEVASEEKVTDL